MNPLYRYSRTALLFFLSNLGVVVLVAQESPRLGFVYPAGVQSGTSVELTIGGRGLGGLDTILFNREGISAEILEHTSNAKRKYGAYIKSISEVYRKVPSNLVAEDFASLQEKARQIEEVKLGNAVSKVPDDLSFRRLPELSLAEFREVAEKFRMMENVQTNAEISELLQLRVTVAQGTPTGLYEMRLSGRRGLSNPLRFHVGEFVEHLESEPNDKGQGNAYDASRPFLLNGQVMPGDVDRFRFIGRAGQKLVFQARARELIPYLADAVPGWFQATLRVTNGEGEEVAFVDDFEYRPDPVLFFQVPADGEYTVEIRDAIYRGREDFVYRLQIGETPFVASIFPLGARLGEERVAKIVGWNLDRSNLKLNTKGERVRSRLGRVKSSRGFSNSFLYALGTAPVKVEGESVVSGDTIVIGETVAGLVSQKGERDVFSFSGNAGQLVHLEVRARRLGSPLDSRLLLLGSDGKVLSEADNLPPENRGLHTDHADSLIEFELPESGIYTVRLDDVQGRGGESFGYLLETGQPEPNFDLLVYPSGLMISPGGSRSVSVKAFRRSGFEGPIKLTLGKDDKGFKLSGGVIPEGQDSAEIVLTASAETGLYELNIFGSASSEDSRLWRRAMPCDRAVQAFITHHFLDTSTFLVDVGGRKVNLPKYDLSEGRVGLQRGVLTELRLRKNRWMTRAKAQFEFELGEENPNVSIEEIREEDDAYVVSLRTDFEGEELEGWIVLQCFVRWQKKDKPGKSRRIHIGTLPAIPYQYKESEEA